MTLIFISLSYSHCFFFFIIFFLFLLLASLHNWVVLLFSRVLLLLSVSVAELFTGVHSSRDSGFYCLDIYQRRPFP